MSDELTNIPLLSGKPLSEFLAAEFRAYVISLYRKYVARKAAVKKPKLPWLASRNKKGTLSIRVRRDPKWLTHEELDSISVAHSIPANELFIRVQKSGIAVVRDESTGAQLTQFAADMPW